MDLKALAMAKAVRYGIPPDLFLRQIRQESGWNPNAVSHAGAQGLGQIIPATQKYLGITDPFDPDQSLDGGARYLKEQYDRFGDWDQALAAYNAGPEAVQKYGGIPPYRETQNYVKAIMGGGQPTQARMPQPTQARMPQAAVMPETPSEEDALGLLDLLSKKEKSKWDILKEFGSDMQKGGQRGQPLPPPPRRESTIKARPNDMKYAMSLLDLILKKR